MLRCAWLDIGASQRGGLSERRSPEPQSTTVFLLLVVIFGAMMWWLAVAKQLNWNAAISDLTGSGSQVPELPFTAAGSSLKFGTLLGSHFDTALAQRDGYVLRFTVRGQRSHLSRVV